MGSGQKKKRLITADIWKNAEIRSDLSFNNSDLNQIVFFFFACQNRGGQVRWAGPSWDILFSASLQRFLGGKTISEMRECVAFRCSENPQSRPTAGDWSWSPAHFLRFFSRSQTGSTGFLPQGPSGDFYSPALALVPNLECLGLVWILMLSRLDDVLVSLGWCRLDRNTLCHHQRHQQQCCNAKLSSENNVSASQ